MFLKFFFMSVNETAIGMSDNTTVCSWGGGYYQTHLLTEVVGTATLKAFDETDGFFPTSCDPNIGHTLRHFSHFT
jgi:hypothetical protein